MQIQDANANTFFRFFSKLADSFLQKLPRPESKFGIKTTEEYYKHIRNECEDLVLCNVDVKTVDIILKNLDVAKASGTDQISSKFLKDGSPVIDIHLANIINVLIKLDAFPSKCKIAKIKLLFKKRIKSEAKNYRPFSLLALISKVIEKSIYDQTRIILKEIYCCTFINQASERIIPQIEVCLG